MGKLNDLTAGNMRDILRRLSRLENASPLSSSSIGRGRMRFYDGSVLLIENGALQVTGTATISGTLKASGVIDFTGNLTQTGPAKFTGTLTISGNTSVTGDFKVTGPTSLEGDTDVTGKLAIKGDTTVSGKLDVTGPMATKGTLSVEGVTTLKNDLKVVSGGKISVGTNMTLNPTSSGGSVVFSNGNTLASDGVMIGMNAGGYASVVSDGLAQMGNSAASVLVAGGMITLRGALTVPSMPSTNNGPNLYVDSSGRIFRCT